MGRISPPTLRLEMSGSLIGRFSYCITPVVVTLAMCLTMALTAKQRLINLNMPDVRPTHVSFDSYIPAAKDESYLCVSHRLNPSEHEFIVGFQPNASATKVHHILIYGCSVPGKFMRDTPNYVWECGEMNMIRGTAETQMSPYDEGPPCSAGPTILFGWALDAPAVEMPPSVGFKIGGDSNINYLVLQVHYGNTSVFHQDPHTRDSSGITLESVSGENHGITKLAGIYLLVSSGYVPMGLSTHTMECPMIEEKVIHPFRFRTHTHKLGIKVAAYKRPAGDPMKSMLIGEHNPQEPQMFYPVDDKSMTISQGDRIYAYCEFNNTRDHVVYIGATGLDEMCNFYMMYWTEGDQLLQRQDCLEHNPH